MKNKTKTITLYDYNHTPKKFIIKIKPILLIRMYESYGDQIVVIHYKNRTNRLLDSSNTRLGEECCDEVCYYDWMTFLKEINNEKNK